MSATIPAAVERAQALLRHCKYLHAPLSSFYLTLSKSEAFELMHWFRTDAAEHSQALNFEQLDADIAQAIAMDNPWYVLENFTLYGLTLLAREALH